MVFKKRAEISMNVIVMTAIALIVLVVVIAIFTGRMGKMNSQLKDNVQGLRNAFSIYRSTTGNDVVQVDNCNKVLDALVNADALRKSGSDYYLKTLDIKVTAVAKEEEGVPCFSLPIKNNKICYLCVVNK